MKEKPKKYFLIPLFIGIAMIVAGIVVLILAGTADVPSMGDSDWFEMESARSAKSFIGVAIIFFGFFVGVSGTIIVYFNDPVVRKRHVDTLAKHKEETIQNFRSFSGQQHNNTNETKVCAYCGSTLSSGANECPHCGAKKTK